MTATKRLKVATVTAAVVDFTHLPKTRAAAVSSSTKTPASNTSHAGTEKSGVPKGLAFWGESKLDI
eukprot:5697568-Pleurochrysis_carterae.AAC.1